MKIDYFLYLARDFDFKLNCFPLLYVSKDYINQNFLIDTNFILAVKFHSSVVSENADC